MITNTDGNERLYLSKEADKTIYIDNCKIPQYQLDGVRFLYRQYKKKKPGVIINDRIVFSRNVQIVLFVRAMFHILKQPVLVLCQEGAEHGWMEQFQTWTDLCDDVVIETQNPLVKKKVLINTMSNLPTFYKRLWSVLVVDLPEIDKASLQFLKLPFKADYKIWITPINIRANLDQFSKLYKWLYPKEEFEEDKFIPDRNNLSDVVDKAILLDAFMEDIVQRNEDAQSPITDIQNDRSPPRRISLKNKDATGTKIKRSKKRIIDSDDDTDSAPIRNNLVKDRELNEDFSIDNFKRKRKELDENVPSDKEESDSENKKVTVNSPSQMNLFYEPDSSSDINSDRLYEMDTLVFGNDACDEQSVNVNETVNDIIEATEDNLGKKDIDEETNLVAEDDTPSDIELDISEKEGKLYINDISKESPSTPKNNEIIKENHVQVKEISLESSSSDDEIKLKTNEVKTCIDSSPVCEEIKTSEDDDVKPTDSDNKIFISDEVQIENNCNDVSEEKGSVTNNVVVSNASKRQGIEDKLKELEDKVMKRFKGSILDSLI